MGKYRLMHEKSTRKEDLPLHFWHLFLIGKLGQGAGAAAGFAKAPVGTSAITRETQRDSAKRGERPAAFARSDKRTTAL